VREHTGCRHDLHHHSASSRSQRIISAARAGDWRGLIRREARIAAAALVLAASNACVTVRPPVFMRAAPERDWPSTLATAEARVSEGRYAVADSILGRFAARYPGSPEAFEAAYWRALLSMDPKNSSASIPTAVEYLDAYLVGLYPRKHRQEAFALRAIAGQIDQGKSALALAQSRDANPHLGSVRIDVPKPTPDPAASEAEIKRLKDELAKANAELERIRRRLAQPPAKTP
jgi:hypothetical protein